MSKLTDAISKDLTQTQKNRCLEYLKTHRQINPLQAWKILGLYRLSAVILKLRQEGWNITTVKTPVRNQFGEQCHVATYVLEND